jgi:hypothetical protein
LDTQDTWQINVRENNIGYTRHMTNKC